MQLPALRAARFGHHDDSACQNEGTEDCDVFIVFPRVRDTGTAFLMMRKFKILLALNDHGQDFDDFITLSCKSPLVHNK